MKNAYILYSCLMVIQIGFFYSPNLYSQDQHEDKPVNSSRLPAKPKQSGDCQVDPRNLTAFANGESQNFKPVVTFITEQSCLNASRSLGLFSIKEGVNFDSKLFKLDDLAQKFPTASFEEIKALETDLIKRIPAILRNENPKASTLFPIIGQMAVLSPGAARKLLAETISLELQNANDALVLGSSQMNPAQVQTLAKSMMRMGANEELISEELSNSIEEKAILAESDSLKRLFLSLSRAASIQEELVPTLTQATEGFNRGVQRGKSIYQSAEKNALLFSSFLTAEALKDSSQSLDAARLELDKTMGALLEGQLLTQSRLKKMWKDVLRVLALSDRFPQLALALSDSLTFQAMYLGTWDQARLLSAAKNYPVLGFSIQSQFVQALDNLNAQLEERSITKKIYNEKIAKYFMPAVSQILSFEQEKIDSKWASRCLSENLILSEDVEKRFPKFVLHLMDRRNKAVLSSTEAGVEPVLNSMAENMAVLWSLGTVHVPALNKWVNENEKE